MKKKIKKFFFHIKNIPHKNIFLYHNISHIYVSLNQAGNLSNSNLECFKAGLCSVIPVERKKNFCDVNIKKYFDENDLIKFMEKSRKRIVDCIKIFN